MRQSYTGKENVTKDNTKVRMRVRQGAFRFPPNIVQVEYDIFKRGENIPRGEHIFCAYCGREITMFHVERCRIVMVDRHVRVTTTDDEFYFYCLPYLRCMEDRKKGIISQGIKAMPIQYTGVENYELQDLFPEGS